MANIINHVAFIMDGNRRWAAKNSVDLSEAYNIGANKLEEVINILIKQNIKVATFYAFSKENWHRDTVEIEYIKKLLLNFLIQKAEKFVNEEIKFICIGNYENFGKKISEKIEALQEKTKNFTKFVVCIALHYSAKKEIIDTVNKLLKQGNTELTIEQFEDNLYTKNLPKLDLIIRTGGYKRLSNFLLWQAAYSELFFIDMLWPDLSEKEIILIFNEFKKTKKNYGR